MSTTKGCNNVSKLNLKLHLQQSLSINEIVSFIIKQQPLISANNTTTQNNSINNDDNDQLKGVYTNSPGDVYLFMKTIRNRDTIGIPTSQHKNQTRRKLNFDNPDDS